MIWTTCLSSEFTLVGWLAGWLVFIVLRHCDQTRQVRHRVLAPLGSPRHCGRAAASCSPLCSDPTLLALCSAARTRRPRLPQQQPVGQLPAQQARRRPRLPQRRQQQRRGPLASSI